MTLVSRFDGTGNVPRELQVECLNWLEQNWAESVVCFQGGTGFGKSAVGVSLMKKYGGVYVVPTNALMDQLIETYPEINYLKGKEHYSLETEYKDSLSRYGSGEPTFVNPYSFKYAKYNTSVKSPPVLIIDECHNMMDTLQLMASSSISTKVHGLPKSFEHVDLVNWLDVIVKYLRSAASCEDDLLKKSQLSIRATGIHETLQALIDEPHIYSVHKDKGRVVFKPIQPPKSVVNEFFRSEKTVLMSATINEFTVKELVQERKVQFKAFGTPIKVEDRQVLYRPAGFAMNMNTPLRLVASWIKMQLRKYPDRNAIVHLTYKDVENIREYIPEALYVTKETKTDDVNEFKKKGGVLLAAACGTGIDLPYDECRLNIIPRLLKPNLMDGAIKKRKALSDGSQWYNHQIIDTLIQQAGRSTRSVDDSSITIVGDKNLKFFMRGIKHEINEDFLSSIKWGKR